MKSIVKIPVSDFPIEPENVYVTDEESGLNSPIGFQFVHMAGCRQFENFCLVLCTCSGNLAQAISDSGLNWTVMNTGTSVIGANVLDWASDEFTYDSEGNVLTGPLRPSVMPTGALTNYYGTDSWVIT